MGRKKRGRVEEPSDVVPDASVEEAPVAKQVKLEAIAQNDPFPEPTAPVIAPATASAPVAAAVVVEDDRKKGTAPAASGYGLHAHSGDMVEEDVYVSDGSEDEADMVAEVVLAGSRMGVMRRGLHHPLLVQPTRQWKREEAAVSEAVEDSAAVPQEEDDALAQLDPAQRAARLLQEKQRKLQEAKETARRMESEENAGRDPCLFSKRTAFDIRMDQIEDKPWIRGDVTDFFNYTLTEEDWMDYSTQQLAIRQELTDAGRQRRPPDPTIVPVMPRAPAKQTPKVAVSGDSDENGTDVAMGDDEEPVIGPAMPHGGTAVDVGTVKTEETEQAKDLQHLGSGGAWGAGAAPGSLLARLIEEQENGGALPTAPVAESSRPYEEVEPYHEPEQHYGRSHDARETYDNSYDRYGGQQQQYQGGGYSGRGGYGGRGGGGGDYEGRPFGGPPPPFGGRGGRGGPPPPFGGRGGRGRGGGYGGEDAYSRKRGHEDYYGGGGGGGWR